MRKLVTTLILTAFTLSLISGASALTTINSCQELQDMDEDLTEDYELGSDIDCAGFDDFPSDERVGFSPIGFEPNDSSGTPGNPENTDDTFTGTFDGNGYTINNLKISTTFKEGDDRDMWEVAMFKRTDAQDENEYIRNFVANNWTIRTKEGGVEDVHRSALIVGNMYDDPHNLTNIEIRNSKMRGSVKNEGPGGIIGRTEHDKSDYTHLIKDITVNNLSIDVEGSYRTGCIIGDASNNGAAGGKLQIENVDINDCNITTYNTFGGTVIGEFRADGSKTAEFRNIDVENSKVDVNGESAGGLFGRLGESSSSGRNIVVEDVNLESTEVISSDRKAGGIVGDPFAPGDASMIFRNISVYDADIEASYWAGGIAGEPRAGDTNSVIKAEDIIIHKTRVTGGSGNSGALFGRLKQNNADSKYNITNITVKDTEVTGNDRISTLIGQYDDDGGVNDGTINSIIKDIYIYNSTAETSSDDRAGGIFGDAYLSSGSKIVDIEDILIENSIVDSSGRFAGGLSGRTDMNSNAELHLKNYTLDNVDISTTGNDYGAGGFHGRFDVSSGTNYTASDLTLRNVNIEGQQDIGGHNGYSLLKDSTAKISDKKLENTTITSLSDDDTGSVIGQSNPREGSTLNISRIYADNVDISSDRSNDAGGIIGDLDSFDPGTEVYMSELEVKDSAIFTDNGRTGGLIGRLHNRENGSLNVEEFAIRNSDITSNDFALAGVIGEIRNNGGGPVNVNQFHVANVLLDTNDNSRTGAIGGNIYDRNYNLVEPADVTFENGYFAGDVNNVPRVFGRTQSLVTNDIYWDGKRAPSILDSSYATDLQTGEMYGTNATNNMALDYGSTWTAKNYPFFDWQELLVPEELPSPQDQETAVDYSDTPLELRPWVFDGDDVTVTWYDADTDSSIGSDVVSSGNLAQTLKGTITAENHTYYAELESGDEFYRTREFEFRTMEPYISNVAPKDDTTQPENRSLEATVEHEDSTLSMDVDFSLDGSNILSSSGVSSGDNLVVNDEILRRGDNYQWCINVQDDVGGSVEECINFDINVETALPPTPLNPVDGEQRVFNDDGSNGVVLEVDVEHPQYTVDQLDVSFISPKDGTIDTKTINSPSGTVSTRWDRGQNNMYGFDRGEKYSWYVSIDDGIETLDNQQNKFNFRIQERPIISSLSPKAGEESGLLSLEAVNPVNSSSMEVEYEVRAEGDGSWTTLGTNTVDGRRGVSGLQADTLSEDAPYFYYWRATIDDGYSETSYEDLSEPFTADTTTDSKPDWFNETFRIPTSFPTKEAVTERSDGDDGLIWIDENQLYWFDPTSSETLKLNSPKTVTDVELPEGTIWVEGTDLYWVGQEDTLNNKARLYTGSLVTSNSENEPGQIWLGSGGNLKYVDESGAERLIG